MVFLLKQLFNLLKLLNSEIGTNQIAAGLAAGFVLGFSPILSLQGILLLFCLLFFRIQIGAATLSACAFSFVAWLLDPLMMRLGSWILEIEPLRPVFEHLYNMPLVPFTRFNNNLVMGAGVFSLVLSPLVFLGARWLVIKYREKILARFEQTKFWKLVKATSFYKWYAQYQELYG